MREFFRGWRRKAGAVPLMMACVLTVPWMRSYITSDLIIFAMRDRQHVVWSKSGQFRWYSEDVMMQWAYPRKWIRDYDPLTSRSLFPTVAMANPDDDPFEISVPYWWFVLPLTILSAYLILWKPRKKESGPTQS
jgi:hypothetical protein